MTGFIAERNYAESPFWAFLISLSVESIPSTIWDSLLFADGTIFNGRAIGVHRARRSDLKVFGWRWTRNDVCPVQRCTLILQWTYLLAYISSRRGMLPSDIAVNAELLLCCLAALSNERLHDADNIGGLFPARRPGHWATLLEKSKSDNCMRISITAARSTCCTVMFWSSFCGSALYFINVPVHCSNPGCKAKCHA